MQHPHDSLILKSLSGAITEEEQQVLSSWRRESAENNRSFEELRKVWAIGNAHASIPDFDTNNEWNRLLQSLDRVTEKDATAKKIYSLRSFAFRMAASVLLLAVSSFLVYFYIFKDNTTIRESGETAIHFSLADGSTVWLNRRSLLVIEEHFGDDTRTVKLEGEAFFDVRKNPDKPFIISAGKATVQVLGTSFNVNIHNGEEKVYVQTGSVRVSSGSRETKFIVLNPGEMGTLDKESNFAVSKDAEYSNALAWKTKQLVFRKTSLEEVTKAMEEYFDITVTVKNQELLKCRFTGSFNDPTLEEITEALSISLNLTITQTLRECTLDGLGCN
jgi:transmembrane sensor